MPAAETVYTEVGSFDAKTKLSEILRKVEQGERFTITRNGKAVASLIPVERKPTVEEVAKAVDGLINFPRIKGIPGDTVLEWIHEGRK